MFKLITFWMANMKKMVCYSTLNPHLIYHLMSLLWILNLSLKLIAEPMYCFPQHLHDIKYIAILEVHFKMPLTLYLRLVAKQVNSVEVTTKLVQMSYFWHFSEELECWLWYRLFYWLGYYRLFYHRIYSRLEFILCRNQLTYFFMLTIWRASLWY